jgi:hypothetical protein
MPPAKRYKPSNSAPLQDRLGKFVAAASAKLLAATSWSAFIDNVRGPPDLQSNLSALPHPAGLLLDRLSRTGVPILQSTRPWSQSQCDAAIARGSHPSAMLHLNFLREEMADMVAQSQWVVIPYSLVQHLPSLRLSPMDVVPQTDRRPRPIVDYSFSNVNRDTILLAPMEAMQFGLALYRVLSKILWANPRFGPVFMIKGDIADGFYRIPLAPSLLLHLAVAFPHLPGEEPLVAVPLNLPMGWVSSPPYFCSFTETAADIANAALSNPSLASPEGRLSTTSLGIWIRPCCGSFTRHHHKWVQRCLPPCCGTIGSHNTRLPCGYQCSNCIFPFKLSLGICRRIHGRLFGTGARPPQASRTGPFHAFPCH